MRKIFLLSLFFLIITSCFLGAKKAYARPIIDKCSSQQECLDMGGVICSGGQCLAAPLAYGDPSLQGYKDNLTDCTKNGRMDIECYLGGTRSAGFFSSLVETMRASLNGLPLSANEALVLGPSSQGVLPMLASTVSYFYAVPPASGTEYLADLGKNFGFVKTSYAQANTSGWNGLKPILEIWKTFRNVAYTFLIIVFVVIGIMIMLRIKIGAKTAVSFQDAIPRLAMTLLFITFSYAIAGLIIDLANIVGALGISIINPSGFKDFFLSFVKDWIITPLNAFLALLKSINPNIRDPIILNDKNPGLLYFTYLFMKEGSSYASIIGFILNPINLILLSIGVPFKELNTLEKFPLLDAFNLPGKIISLVFSIILIGIYIKLIWALLKTYITIIVTIIFSPFQIMLNAIPGNDSMSKWLSNLIGNVAVFPAVLIMFAILSKLLEIINGFPGGANSLWVPSPLTPPARGSSNASIVTSIIGFGMLLLISKVPDMVKEAVKVSAFKYGTAIGEALKPVTQPLQKGWSATTGAVSSEIKEQANISVGGIREKMNEQRASQRETPTPPTLEPSDVQGMEK